MLPRQPIKISVSRIYIPATNTEEAEAEWFCEAQQDLLELTPKKKKKKKKVLFIIADWNAKLGTQEIPIVTGIFDLRVQNKAGQKLTILGKQNTLVIENSLFQQNKRQFYT